MMWIFLLLAAAATGLAAVAYLVSRFHRLSPIARLGRAHRGLSWLAAAAPVALLGACFAGINLPTAIVVLLHLVLFWLLCELAGRLWARLAGGRLRRDAIGVAALCLTAAYLGLGWFMAHHVFRTEYALETEKNLGDQGLRVAVVADAHLGITLDGKEFARLMARVQAESPDLVVIVGDFVDDDSGQKDMLEACAALGRLETTCGVYFVFGNHDEGYFDHRDFTAAQLREALEQSGVVILEDEAAPAGDFAWVVGRKDRSMPGRRQAAELTAGLDTSKYVILLDHQPNDYANEAVSGADLVLSGHTHGGHLFPAGWIGLALGANDRVYGRESRGNATFIVTSGVSGWAIPFKTGTFSEYVVIDIAEARAG